jgi:NADPH:quinone reductase-like Zn-dependent oxidoreductase
MNLFFASVSLGNTASPEHPAEKPFDVLVYGGSTASGTMAIQLLKL